MGDFIKDDEGKADFTLIPQEALLEVAKVFTFGAKKYKIFSYSLGADYRRYVAAAHRHMNQWLRGENNDAESGANHLSAAIASLMMALDNQLTFQGKDDRNEVYRRARTVREAGEIVMRANAEESGILDKEMD